MNVKQKKYPNTSLKENINNPANFDVNKGQQKCYRCGDLSHLTNSCIYFNTICNNNNK